MRHYEKTLGIVDLGNTNKSNVKKPLKNCSAEWTKTITVFTIISNKNPSPMSAFVGSIG